MDNALEIPCVICNRSIKCSNQCLSFNEKKFILFLLTNLLDIPKPQEILNGEADSDWDEDYNEQHLNDNYWNVVKICECCGEAVKEANIIYKDIRKHVRKFREIQRKIVDNFKKSRKSASSPPNGEDDRLNKFINKCQGIIKNYDFNEFGFPFVVREENEEVSDDLVNSNDYQPFGGHDVIIKKETSETQQILLIFPGQANEEHQNKVDSESEDDPDFGEEVGDDDDDNREEMEDEDGTSSENDDSVESSKPNIVRVSPSPKPKQRRRRKTTNPENKWPCPLCHFKYPKSGSLKTHLKHVHPKNSIDFHQLKLKYLQVNSPGAPPPSSEVLQKAAKHLGVSSFELEYPQLNCKRNSQGKFPCPWADPSQCPKIFGAKVHLIRHLKVHHLKLKLFVCSWSEIVGGSPCGKSFATRNNYKYHLDEHRGTPRFKCEECNMTFYKGNYLTIHKQLKHSNEKFICEICGQEFPCKGYLSTHKNLKHEDNRKEKMTEIICDLCGKLFKSRLNLKNHVQRVHEKMKGKLCHLCDKWFMGTYHLNVHLWEKHQLRVEGFQPKEKVARKDKLQCEVKGCRRLYLTKENLERHTIEVHGEDGKKPGAWNCKYCGKNFFQKTKWEHCERTHENTESRPERCEVCGKGFPTRFHLRCHQRSTHKMQLEKETRWTRKENK